MSTIIIQENTQRNTEERVKQMSVFLILKLEQKTQRAVMKKKTEGNSVHKTVFGQ